MANPLTDGYLGHLNAAQDKLLQQWKQEVSKEENKAPAVASDDYALLRFLRARKFDAAKAREMRNKHLEWRKKFDVDNMLKNKPSKVDLIGKLLPSRHHGFDKEGRPVIYEKVGKTDGVTLNALVTPDEYLRAHIYKMETLIARCEESKQQFKKPTETFTMCIDLSGVMIDTKKGSDSLTMCSENDNLNYPERMGKLVIINAPWIFPFIWKIVSPFIDARTKAKISIVYGSPLDELSKLIELDQIPKEYGGKCECNGDSKLCVTEFDNSKLKMSDVSGIESENDSTEIAAGATFSQELKLPEKGGAIHWFFRTQSDYNCNFSVEMTLADNKTKEMVKKPVRCVADQGSYSCDHAASFLVKWDNSFSWFRAKRILYSCVAIPKESAPPVVDTAAAAEIAVPSATRVGRDDGPDASLVDL